MVDVTNAEELDALAKLVEGGARTVGVDALLAGAHQAIEFRAFEKAVDILNAVLVLNPEHARAWAYLGIAHDELGHRDEAARAYQRALTFDEEDFATALALASLQIENGETEPARALLNWLLLECQDDAALARARDLKHRLPKPTEGAE